MANYYTPFSLRISEELLGKIKQIAVQNKRSANKEIEFVLERYVREYEAQHGEIETETQNGRERKTAPCRFASVEKLGFLQRKIV